MRISHEAQLEQGVAALARADFGVFAARAFYALEGENLVPNWHIDAIAALAARIENGLEKRAIICMPPRYLKSFMMNIAFPAWCLGRKPKMKIVCCSYGGDLAEKFSSDTLRLMRTPWYRKVFPDTHVSPIKATKTNFETTAGGVRFASSVGGTLTGRGADIIIIDDPLKANEAHSVAMREACVDWFNNSVRTRLNNPKTGRFVVVAQRLHAEDLPGHLLDTGGWTPLVIPAIQWQDTLYRMGPDLKSASVKAGRVLQPERQDLADLEQLRSEMGERDFEAQYNQRPLPPGGAIFKSEWLKRYDARPTAAHTRAIVQSWDTAYEDNVTSDYSVCTTWAICGEQFYLLDVWRGRPKFFELESKVYELRQKWSANIVIVERAGSGISLLQNIHDQSGHRWLVNMSPAGAKISRAEQQTPKFEQGRIWLPTAASWLDSYEKELLAFPHGKHDDQVDSSIQLLAAFYTGSLMNAVQNFGHT